MLPEDRTQKSLLNEMMGKNGIVVINDTNEHNGKFSALYVVEDAVISTDIENFTALNFSAGACLPFDFQEITLGSGVVIVYGKEVITE
jgi:hypothetical protein